MPADSVRGSSRILRGPVSSPMIPVADRGADDIEVGARIRTEQRGRRLEVAHQDRGAVVERVCELNGGLDPAKAVAVERELGEEWRARAEGVDGAADVVDEAGEGQLSRPAPASDGRLGFDELHRAAGARERDRGCETIRPPSHNHGVERVAPVHG
jgi:hypothetical protein